MVDRYGLQLNKHIISLYALQNFWALSFLRHYFFAGFMSKSVTDSVSAFIQRIVSAQSKLDCFIDKVAEIEEYKDHCGSKHKMKQNAQKVSLKTGSPLESHAATVLTPFAFSILQEELVLAPQYASILVGEGCFHIRHHTEIDGGWKMMWDPRQELIRCSCHQFEFLGIFCRHILRVFSTNNCFRIPDSYLPLRWRLVSKENIEKEKVEKVKLLESLASTIVSELVVVEERLDFACEQMSAVLSHIKQISGLNDHDRHVNEMGFNSPSGSLILPEVEDSDDIVQSFTLGDLHESFLGKLKERSPNVGVGNVSRKRQRCCIPCCGQFEHDASNCPILGSESLHSNGDPLGFL
ncbi:unnamed protein product [Amaranthus hypochondriacus]